MAVKDIPFKKTYISWTIEEHLKLFNEIKRLYFGEKLKGSDKEKITKVINILPESRRKNYNQPMARLILKGYKVWIKDEKSEDWIQSAYQQRNDVKKFGTTLKKNVEVIHVEKVKEIQPEFVTEEVKVEQKSIPMMVSHTLSSMNAVTGSLVKEMIKLDAKVNKSNELLAFLIQNIVPTKEAVKQKPEQEVIRKPAEIVRISNDEVTHEPFNPNDGFMFHGTVAVKPKPFETKLPEDAFGGHSLIKEDKEAESNPVTSGILTEEFIRSIVRSEIEKIFGPIGEKATVINDIAKTIIEPGEKIPEPVLPKEKIVKQPNPIRIFVYGINSNQAMTIKEGLPLNMTIESADVFNDSTRQRARNCDSVLVTKYSKHSVYESFRSTCGIEKVSFVSGGITMLKRRLTEIADKAIQRK